MQELKERIQKEGKVLPGNIVKVDGFLNHRVDCQLMGRMADEFAKIFDISKVDLILTAEASGIALAAVCAYKYGIPMVYAKKAKSDNIEGGLYKSEVYSYTYKKKVTQILSKEWLTSAYHVLILDDFMANGEAVRGLCDLVSQAAELSRAGRHRKGRRKRHHLPRRGLRNALGEARSLRFSITLLGNFLIFGRYYEQQTSGIHAAYHHA